MFTRKVITYSLSLLALSGPILAAPPVSPENRAKLEQASHLLFGGVSANRLTLFRGTNFAGKTCLVMGRQEPHGFDLEVQSHYMTARDGRAIFGNQSSLYLSDRLDPTTLSELREENGQWVIQTNKKSGETIRSASAVMTFAQSTQKLSAIDLQEEGPSRKVRQDCSHLERILVLTPQQLAELDPQARQAYAKYDPQDDRASGLTMSFESCEFNDPTSIDCTAYLPTDRSDDTVVFTLEFENGHLTRVRSVEFSAGC